MNQLKLKCPSGKFIKWICINEQCQFNSFHCDSDNECDACQVHKKCYIFKFSQFASEIEQNINRRKDLIDQWSEIQAKIFEVLKKIKIKIVSDSVYGKLGKRQTRLVEQLYQQNIYENFQSRDIKEIRKQIKENQVKISEEEDLFKNLNTQILNFLHRYTEEEYPNLKLQSSELEINYEQNRSLDIPEIPHIQLKMDQMDQMNQINQMDSSIIQLDYPTYEFLQKAIGTFKGFELLYRGSQNGFSASKFHQKCDGIENTLVILKNEFGKIFGGFTPLEWSQRGRTKSIPDNSLKSCLLSFSMRKKMKLQKKRYRTAIYCYNFNGPIFGRGHDIFISDQCNQNRRSFAFFPQSYNNGKYKLSPESVKDFCGAAANATFRVLEYEVFKVIF